MDSLISTQIYKQFFDKYGVVTKCEGLELNIVVELKLLFGIQDVVFKGVFVNELRGLNLTPDELRE